MAPPAIDVSTLEGGLYAYNGDKVIACAIVFCVLCTIFVILRFLAQHIGERKLSMEDWIMIPSWLLMMGLCVNVICSVKFGGVGRHEAYVLKYEPQAMGAWAKTLFIAEFMYGLLIPLTKTSILLLYLRLFYVHSWFRYMTYVLIIYIWLWGISESLVAIFQCHPIEYQWNKTIKGTCINQLSYYRWVSVPNVIHDVVMLVIPAPVVWQLQIGTRQRLALTGIFLVGSVGCVASFIRMYNFFKLNALSDNTWASIPLMSWTLAEPGVILICACVPSLWTLLRRIYTTGRTKSGFSSRRTAETGSKQRKDNLTQNSQENSFSAENNDTIPLRNINEVTGGYEVSSLSSKDMKTHGSGIQVTRDYTVTRPS